MTAVLPIGNPNPQTRSASFATEGRLREAAFVGGRWCDVVLMGALRPVPE
jgi:RimJ/RimL family protein N-acetyltransferase